MLNISGKTWIDLFPYHLFQHGRHPFFISNQLDQSTPHALLEKPYPLRVAPRSRLIYLLHRVCRLVQKLTLFRTTPLAVRVCSTHPITKTVICILQAVDFVPRTGESRSLHAITHAYSRPPCSLRSTICDGTNNQSFLLPPIA